MRAFRMDDRKQRLISRRCGPQLACSRVNMTERVLGEIRVNAAGDGPQKTGAAGIVEGPLRRTTEQSHRIPAQSGGTLDPVFRGPQEFIAVFNELAPTVPRDVTGRTIRVKPGNTLDPINGKLRLRCS
jgi:hypothetical protein